VYKFKIIKEIITRSYSIYALIGTYKLHFYCLKKMFIQIILLSSDHIVFY